MDAIKFLDNPNTIVGGVIFLIQFYIAYRFRYGWRKVMKELNELKRDFEECHKEGEKRGNEIARLQGRLNGYKHR